MTCFLCFDVAVNSVVFNYPESLNGSEAATLLPPCGSAETSLLIWWSEHWLSLTSGSVLSLHQSAHGWQCPFTYWSLRDTLQFKSDDLYLMRAGGQSWCCLALTAAEHDWGEAPVTLHNQGTEIYPRRNKYLPHDDLIYVLMLDGSIIPVVLLWFYHIIYSEAEERFNTSAEGRHAAEDVCVFIT